MKFKLVYIIHLLILGLLIASILGGIINLADILEATGDDFSFRSSYFSSSFKITFFLIFPTIGIFIRNKVGWVFINHYFYFIVCNLLINLYEARMYGYEDFLILIIFGLLILSILFIMNKDKVFSDYYKIEKESLIGINLISFVIGLCISMMFFLTKNEYHLN